ncbi:Chemotaxis protein CheY-P-specific phosphatase CheC [Halorientalis persicus]|uniref:Chemotaxis protein CheY-P-specific phosphatase CheC n=1 Tax=Halorientalis persicus TaxID=1367881 RepID=A0A1H8LDI5_9EURY|nr:chemotaxis protein CheC [Halorientalis persicus]SEO03232.1 Chemotaxis protein CheY-P-specific phosphatase CheC [Halorientalis persicus]
MKIDIDALEELNLLTRDGTERANGALTDMTAASTAIGTTKILLVNHEDIIERIDSGGYEVVRFDIEGKLSGTALLLFDRPATEAVVEALVPGEADESMASAGLKEMANIMMGSFTTDWGDHLSAGLSMTAPTYLDDPDADALQLDPTGPETDSTLVFQSSITWRSGEGRIDIYLAPDRSALDPVFSEAERDEIAERDDELDGLIAPDEDDEPTTAAADTATPDPAAADTTTDDEREDGDPFGGSAEGAFGASDDADGLGTDDATSDGPGSFDPGDEDDLFGFEEGAEGADEIPLEKLSVFSDLTKEGTEAAAERVTQMTGIETSTEIAGITFTPIDDIAAQLEDGDYVGTTVEFDGTPSGSLVILFDEDSAENIAEEMLPVDPDEDGLTGMHESAIEELGNIMTSGFIDGWANVLETGVEHTPPEYVGDMNMAFVELITEQLGPFQTHAFTIESTLQTDDVEFTCEIHALPDEGDLSSALKALAVDRKDQTDADPSDLF